VVIIFKDKHRRNKFIGWIAVSLSTVILAFWAFWGVVENFHEGWYYSSLWMNLGLMLTQYLGPMLVFMSLTVLSIFSPRAGAVLHGLVGVLAIVFFRAFSNAATFLIILPLFGLGLMYWFGRLQRRRTTLLIVLGVPLLTIVVSGIEPALRVAQRVNDGYRGIRYVEGNGVGLYWAPDGPGWPGAGGDWFEAREACRTLSEDGQTQAGVPQEIWRLPTVEEAVRSMARHGVNSGGEWHAEAADAAYLITPDKETPLWDVGSQVIYWWTGTEVDQDRAYIIAYDGKVWPRSKQLGPDNLGYRCVKQP
jgi:hypothetical protein